MFKLFGLIVGLVLVLPATAGEWALQAHVASHHFKQRAGVDWNGSNDGFGLRYSFNNEFSAQIGHYRNSNTFPGYNFFTTYGVVDWTPYNYDKFHFGVFGGIASGYNSYQYSVGPNNKVTVVMSEENALIPAAGLISRWQGEVFNVAFRLVPQATSSGSAAIGLEVGFKFK